MGVQKLDIDSVKNLAVRGVNYAQAAKELSVSRSTVRRFAEKHNIVFSGKRGRYFDDPSFISEVIRMYDSGMMGDDIADFLSVNRKTVFSILRENHKLRSISENYTVKGRTIKSNSFSDAGNDRLAAYFYGWLLTDGCMSDNGRVEISLQYADREVIERLKEFLNCSVNISDTSSINTNTGKRHKVSRFSFSDPQIISDLKSLGMTPRKSCKEKLPSFDWKNGKTAKDFWQGVIEGDGCIACYKNKGIVGLVGSEELLSGFKEYCKDVVGVRGDPSIHSNPNTSADFRSITYSGKDAALICKHLYSDIVSKLQRKYDKAMIVIENHEKLQATKTKFITYKESSSKYEVRTPSINGKVRFLASFDTLKEAEDNRDEFLELYRQMLET